MKFLRRFFRGDESPTIIVVSGLPRSGTSMMMKMLEAGGIPPLTDRRREADQDNPEGYYEFERVKQIDKGDTAWLAQAEGKAVKVISALLQHLPREYHYRVLFMERHLPEILSSQQKMLVRRGEDAEETDDEKLMRLFTKHLQQVRGWLAEQNNFDVLYLHYSDILADPEAMASAVNDFLVPALDVEKMAHIVDPTLYRNRQRQLSA